ncbi:hypothetical protein RIF29_36632 [Crotalaria pallida]|uniref:Uncharacterized protein n=1 Tax=Crotalaria pallida TaxID=3830 RepID=A0AAN9EBP3_CROPI
MKLSQTMTWVRQRPTSPLVSSPLFSQNPNNTTTTTTTFTSSNGKSRVSLLLGYQSNLRFPNCSCTNSSPALSSPHVASNPVITHHHDSPSGNKLDDLEEGIEKVIYRFRFMAILGVFGSLVGSVLCFIKGCTLVAQTFWEYFVNHSKIILLLIEAVDLYLLGTVMLVFGMGLYELFISNLDSAGSQPSDRSNLFGLFTLKGRPKWLNIKSVNELKTKVGHVIVMLLLIGLFDKSKKAAIHSPVDLLCFCASVLLSSSCLFLLSKLNEG